MLYGFVSGLVALTVLLTFSSEDKPPAWHKGLCAVGFVVAMCWISTIADEVVGVLRAFGAILGVSEAILGVTAFAMVISFVTHLTTGKFVIGFCGRCYYCKDGVSHDGHVRLFWWPHVKYSLCHLVLTRHFTWCWSIGSIHKLNIRTRISRQYLSNASGLHNLSFCDPHKHIDRRAS